MSVCFVHMLLIISAFNNIVSTYGINLKVEVSYLPGQQEEIPETLKLCGDLR